MTEYTNEHRAYLALVTAAKLDIRIAGRRGHLWAFKNVEEALEKWTSK